MDKQIETFISEKSRELIQIYIAEYKTRGEGILLLSKQNKEKVDVRYITLDLLDNDTLMFILERKKQNKPSIAYILIIDEEKINEKPHFLEIDLDTNQ